MNIKQLFSLTAISALAGASATPALGEADITSKITFACEINNGIPTTVVQAEETQKTIFNWKSDRLSQNKNPHTLCEDVSATLNEYLAQKDNLSELTFIGSDQMGIPSVCATDKSPVCDRTLFTLSPVEQQEANIVADKVLEDILARDLATNKVVSRQRGLQSVSYRIPIWELIF